MANTSRWSDHEVEQLISRLLLVGVMTSAVIVLIGGILLLMQHGGEVVSYSVFHGQPAELRSLASIVRGAATMNSLAIVQLGLLLLIATPVARVAFTLVAFLIQRDRMYVVLTTIVLALLLFGLIFGKA